MLLGPYLRVSPRSLVIRTLLSFYNDAENCGLRFLQESGFEREGYRWGGVSWSNDVYSLLVILMDKKVCATGNQRW